MLSGIDIASVLPFAVATVFGILVLLLEVFQRPSFGRGYLSYITALGCALTAATAFFLMRAESYATFDGVSTMDTFGLAMSVLFAVGGGLAALVAPGYLAEQRVDRGEYYALILFAVGGMCMMASANDFGVFFVGLEIQSVAVYALAAYLRPSGRSAEAGMKYFIIGAFASALLLYGVALIYGVTGTTNFTGIGNVLSGELLNHPAMALSDAAHQGILAAAAGIDASQNTLFGDFGGMGASISMAHIGVVLIVVAFFIKIAAAPFHMWAPDAYTGTPTPAVGFLAAAAKMAGVAALVRILAVAFFGDEIRGGAYGWMQILFWVALASMIVGNLAALVQTNVKRMLAYSSVAHAGYLLVALVGMGFGNGNIDLASGVVFYGFAYTFGTVGAFGALAYLGKKGLEAEDYSDLNGVGFKYPWLGAALSIFMLSSAGIPPTAGFIGKFLVFKSAVDASVEGAALGFVGDHMLIVLVAAGILTSVTGVYYYLRVIVHLYMKRPVRASGAVHHPGAKFAIILCAAATLWFGMFPGKLTALGDLATAQMVDRADGSYTADPVED